MRHPFLGSSLFVLTLGLAAACSFQTAEEAIREIGQAFCTRVKDCNPTGFKATYNDDISKCADVFVNALPADDRDKRSKCDEDEINTCENDIKALSCEQLAALSSASGTSTLPASCQKC